MNNSQESVSEWKGEKQKEGKKIKWQECNCGKKFASQNSYNNHFKTNHPELVIVLVIRTRVATGQ